MNSCFRVSVYRIYLLLIVLLVIAGCAPAAPTLASVRATSTLETIQPTQPPTALPTAESKATLEAGQWTYIFYHDGLEQIVLVNGGPERGKPVDEPLELWSWNGTQWSLISADENGPVWRNWAGVAYNSSRDVLVIHGGIQNASVEFDETWEWDGETWMRFTETGPGAREGAMMVYDVAREKSVLFGGATENLEVQGDTWEWDGQQWAKVDESGPPARFPGGMLYDPTRQEVLMYSGHFAEATGGFVDYDDLWAWNGETWRQVTPDGPTPGPRNHTALVFDPRLEHILMIGGGDLDLLGDTWGWDGVKWEEIPTINLPARSGHSVAYDPLRDKFILYGGVDRPGGKALTDTWEWDRETWTCVEHCQ